MLTPASNDKNRKSELKRRKEDPASFGQPIADKRPDDWVPNKGLAKTKSTSKVTTKQAAKPAAKSSK